MSNGWYVAIMDFGFGRCMPFSGVGSPFYVDFKQIAKKHKIRVVAEVSNIPGEALDRVGESGLLMSTADRAVREKGFDAQAALEEAFEYCL